MPHLVRIPTGRGVWRHTTRLLGRRSLHGVGVEPCSPTLDRCLIQELRRTLLEDHGNGAPEAIEALRKDQCSVETFLELDKDAKVLLVDARSEGEFRQGHLVGAVNIPLLSNGERADVGKAYKRNGRERAIELGFELVAPKQDQLVRDALEHMEQARASKLAIYCARGGLRSNLLGWLLGKGLRLDSKYVLRGGYKAFRQFASSRFDSRLSPAVVVIAGLTGSGKSMVLRRLGALFEQQVLDLERIARHAGSAFGGAGVKGPQPSTEHFLNLIAHKWMRLDPSRPVFIEDEGRALGHAQVPEELYKLMRESRHVLTMRVPKEERVRRLVSEYAEVEADEFFVDAIRRIEKRLGGERAARALGAFSRRDYETVADILLHYYDKRYTRHLHRGRSPDQIIDLCVSSEDLPKYIAQQYGSRAKL